MTWDARRRGTHDLACTRCGRELYLEQAVLVAGLRVCATGPCADARRKGTHGDGRTTVGARGSPAGRSRGRSLAAPTVPEGQLAMDLAG
jgi:hypothetical protein